MGLENRIVYNLVDVVEGNESAQEIFGKRLKSDSVVLHICNFRLYLKMDPALPSELL